MVLQGEFEGISGQRPPSGEAEKLRTRGLPLTREEHAKAIRRIVQIMGEQGATDKEIAESLNVSPATVSRTRSKAAIRALVVPEIDELTHRLTGAVARAADTDADGRPIEREATFADYTEELKDSMIEAVIPLHNPRTRKRGIRVAQLLAHGIHENWTREDYRNAARLLRTHPDLHERIMETRGAPPTMSKDGDVYWDRAT